MKVRTRKYEGVEGDNREPFFSVREVPLNLVESGVRTALVGNTQSYT